MKIVILGAPRTLKNRPQSVLSKSTTGKGQRCPWCGRPVAQHLFPSAPWREWLKDAVIEVDGVKLVETGKGKARTVLLWAAPARPWTPLAEPLNAAAVFYRAHDGPGDLVGYLQGVADLLEERGVLADDGWFWGWDGSRLTTTSGRPRVELELTFLHA